MGFVQLVNDKEDKVTKVIDTANNVGDYAEELYRSGVRCVMRYYNHRNVTLPEKRLTHSEAEKLTEAGLSIGVVFQQRGGAGGHIADFEPSDARRDAERALELADALGQPGGSAISFAVDHDFVRISELEAIQSYFDILQTTLDGRFRLGAYGSGHVLGRLQRDGLSDLSWLSQSTGWTGHASFLASQEWALSQGPVAQWPRLGFAYDGNRINSGFSDFGQFNLAAPTETQHLSSPTRALYRVIARSGLNLRRGPSSEFSVIRTLGRDTIVDGLSFENGWVQVDVDGDEYADGYVFGGYLQLVAGGLDAPATSCQSPFAYARHELAKNVSEVAGPGSHPRITLYHASTDKGAPDAVPWCSSFVNWCVEQSGLIGTDSKWAMSWHDTKWGEDVSQAPQEGDIAVYERRWRKKDGSVGIGGHVGFVASLDAQSISLLGGNQNDRVSISPYPRDAGDKGSQTYRLLSIRRPVGLPAEVSA